MSLFDMNGRPLTFDRTATVTIRCVIFCASEEEDIVFFTSKRGNSMGHYEVFVDAYITESSSKHPFKKPVDFVAIRRNHARLVPLYLELAGFPEDFPVLIFDEKLHKTLETKSDQRILAIKAMVNAYLLANPDRIPRERLRKPFKRNRDRLVQSDAGPSSVEQEDE